MVGKELTIFWSESSARSSINFMTSAFDFNDSASCLAPCKIFSHFIMHLYLSRESEPHRIHACQGRAESTPNDFRMITRADHVPAKLSASFENSTRGVYT